MTDKPVIFIDTETYCELDLKKVGVHVYVNHHSFRATAIAWGTKNSECKLYLPIKPDSVWPVELQHFIDDPFTIFIGWNAAFDRLVLNKELHRRGLAKIPSCRWECAATRAAAHGLPLSLDLCAQTLGYRGKDRTGQGEMLMLCKPGRSTGKQMPYEGNELRYKRLGNYCVQDVNVMQQICHFLDSHDLHLSEQEKELYFLDQNINDYGIPLDTYLVNKGKEMYEQAQRSFRAEMEGITGLNRAGPEAYRKWVMAQGLMLKNMQAATIKKTLQNTKLVPSVAKVLKAYTVVNKKAPAKFTSMLEAMSSDNRVRGAFLMNGAATGRWAGRRVQFQNIARPLEGLKPNEIIADICFPRSMEFVEAIHGAGIMDLLSATVRGAVQAGQGNKLIVRDFAQIEARVLAWLAKDEKKLDLFRTGKDVYKHSASAIYQKPVSEITYEERFIGKTAELALGYGGGQQAFMRMANNFNAPVSSEQAEAIKTRWRRANLKTVQFWRKLETVWKTNASKNIAPGPFTFIKMPSGRRLYYLNPLICEGDLTYTGLDTYTRKWGKTTTYGGKLCENIVQALSRDILAHAMLRVMRNIGDGMIVLHVHDEIVIEVSDDSVVDCDEALKKAMNESPEWAEGLPMASEGYISQRYRK